jgi:probable HAF family extracellular repeat protein
MIDIGTLGGTSGFVSGGLNNQGQVAGQSNLAGDLTAHAFLWDKGKLSDLGTPGGNYSVANGINDAGEVIGGGTTAGDLALHAFFWKLGALIDLGTVGGSDCSNAFGINSNGQVVGQSFDCVNVLQGQRAFLWEKGSIVDLNVFVPPGSNLVLTDVEEINDRGEMFGSAVLPNGDGRAFLLIPVCADGTEGCADAPLDQAVVALSRATSGAAAKAMTAPELAAFKEKIARMAGRDRAFGLRPRR